MILWPVKGVTQGTSTGAREMMMADTLVSEIAACEALHFVFGCLSSLAGASLALLLIWITYRYGSSASRAYRYRLMSSTLARAGSCIVIFSLSVAVVLHILEDYYLGWF